MHAASSLLEMFSSDEHLSLSMEVAQSSAAGAGSGSVGSKGALRQVAFNEAYDCLGMQSESLLKKGILTALTLQRVRTRNVECLIIGIKRILIKIPKWSDNRQQISLPLILKAQHPSLMTTLCCSHPNLLPRCR